MDDAFINDIYAKLKSICKEHNDKLSDWFDEKYHSDLENFNIQNNKFFELMEMYNANSFISIQSTENNI
jgi:hypothetical protein